MTEVKFEAAKARTCRASSSFGMLFESEAEFAANPEKQRAGLQAILADP